MQQQLGQHVHVGGKTALALHGSGHLLSMKVRGNLASSGGSAWLFSAVRHTLPAWLLRGEWGVTFRVARLALLSPDDRDSTKPATIVRLAGTRAHPSSALRPPIARVTGLSDGLRTQATWVSFLSVGGPIYVSTVGRRCLNGHQNAWQRSHYLDFASTFSLV